jgi:two-component system sensor histidine kinase RegB
VLARDLELSLGGERFDDESLHDVQLIRGEIDRCRRILNSLASSAGEGVGEQWLVTSADELLALAAELPEAERLDVVIAPEIAGRRFRLPPAPVCQALRAIVQNALQASPPLSRVAIEASRHADALVVAITDRGSGMTDDVLRHACEPFFTTKEPGAGMGLGLFLARRVVERLGGSLAIESKPGAGTTVKLLVPLTTSAALATTSMSRGSA